MVHAVRIKDGAASYCNHWVRTHKLAEEQRAKFPIYAKVRGWGFVILRHGAVVGDVDRHEAWRCWSGGC